MIRSLRISAILFSVLLLGACANIQVGRDFDVGVFTAKFEQGVTTRDQVKGWLGEPAAVGVSMETNGERLDQWSYYYAEGQMQDMSTAKLKLLQIKFDKEGKVRSYNWSASK